MLTMSVPDEGYLAFYMLTMSVPDEGYFRNASFTLFLDIYNFVLLQKQ